MAEVEAKVLTDDETTAPNPSKFRFKSKRKRDREESDDAHSSRRNRKRRRSDDEGWHHTSSWRHRRSKSPASRYTYHSPLHDDPSTYDDTYLPNARSDQYMDHDTAFRESLFDALADDEGAQYWEGVYGQPMHVYPNTYEGPQGELEQMTDEEYASYVRGKMWEKSHQHVVEEREKREKQKSERREREKGRRRMEEEHEEHEEFKRRVEESLRRGEERRSRKRWKGRWEEYVQAWERVAEEAKTAASASGTDAKPIELPWPIESGRRHDVSKEMVEEFFRRAPPEGSGLLALLKTERVRWHPDKVQQRMGSRIHASTLKSVTSVFQIVDSMWSALRDKKS
ncbi:hypothetical protein P152DRAFT_462208 [Eremomyces bilateralis CBS 781.70]|uniref:Uncharacterized protein n=1 Tax=Eremomyces bilateralis CBS 781.70 TaxID=1392243 RepID=A0A6G1FT03_9PEZI|nr:uncharacterized protein P152DRAFT_462208 [Eremomyces bilateralis CBS 781.70]KAF1808809.1 hypothetical protein P152DRAFT_462208 [Eremomyces bilateralis CBS 781.70]